MTNAAANNVWKSRIVGYDSKPAKEFVLNPLNPKRHPEAQQAAIAAVLGEIGWVTGVIENIRTGHLIDGESRITEAVKTNPDEIVPFIKVDLSVEEEKKVLLIFDRIGTLALDDIGRIADLMESISFESETLAALFNRSDEPLDLDDFFEPSLVETKPETFSMIVEFDSEDQYQRLVGGLRSSKADAKNVLLG